MIEVEVVTKRELTLLYDNAFHKSVKYHSRAHHATFVNAILVFRLSCSNVDDVTVFWTLSLKEYSTWLIACFFDFSRHVSYPKSDPKYRFGLITTKWVFAVPRWAPYHPERRCPRSLDLTCYVADRQIITACEFPKILHWNATVSARPSAKLGLMCTATSIVYT